MSLHAKSVVYKDLWLKMKCLDKNETTVAQDSVMLQSDGNWKETVLGVSGVDQAELVYIEIKGKTDFSEKNNSALWLDKMSIKLDQAEIQDLNNPMSMRSGNSIKPSRIISLSKENNFENLNKIDDLKNHRIIALGETVHGSESINKAACRFIQYLVEKENCKLVLFEYFFSRVMTWNRYIQGDTRINIDSLVTAEPFLTSPDECIKLIHWLKNYNDTAREKVNLVGIDVASQLATSRGIVEYIAYLNRECGSLDSLCFLVKINRLKEAWDYVRENDNIFKIQLEAGSYKTLIQSLKIYGELNYSPNFHNYISLRDSFMWVNTKFALDNFLRDEDEKAVLYTHLGHANKLNSPPLATKSLGNNLYKDNETQYYVIGFLTGTGTITAWNDTILENDNLLMPPPQGSLEHLCMEVGDDSFFFKLPEFNTLVSHRFQGNGYTPGPQFDYCALNRRMDACVFIKESNGFEIPSDWPRTVHEVMVRKQKYKQEVLSVIKSKWK